MKNAINAATCLMCFVLTGCMDGPFYALKKVNPYFLSEWRKDRAHGETFGERYEELVSLERRVGNMAAEEQTQWVQSLGTMARQDPSPEIRRQAVRCIAQMQVAGVDEVLNAAANDEVEKVRLAACEAYQYRDADSAKSMLLTLAKEDASNSVRQAAIASLANFEDPEAIRGLGSLLDDTSPAIRYNVAQSLASMTGQDFGGDMSGWKNYIASVAPAPASNSGPTLDVLSPLNSSNTRMAVGPNQLPLPQ